MTVYFRFFGEQAVEILSHLYRNNEWRCCKLLMTETPSFGSLTLLELAANANNRSVVAHSASQSVLNKIWTGKVASDTSFAKVNY